MSCEVIAVMSPETLATLRAIPFPAVIVTPDLVAREVSDTYLSATKRRRDALVGATFTEALAGVGGREQPALFDTLSASLSQVLETRRPHVLPELWCRLVPAEHGGVEERCWRMTNVPVMNAEGELTHIVHGLEDVTDAARSARGSSSSGDGRGANTPEASVTHVDEPIHRLLSSLAHDLRTPLNAIQGFAYPLRRDKREPLSARGQERVQQIIDGVVHLDQMLQDLHELVRIADGRETLKVQPTSLLAVLENVKEALEAAPAAMHIEIAPSASPDLTVSADHKCLVRILTNLGQALVKHRGRERPMSFSTRLLPQNKVHITLGEPDDGALVDATVSDGAGRRSFFGVRSHSRDALGRDDRCARKD